MAMKDNLASSSAADWSPSRRCMRISPCLLISSLLLFFLLVQFDLVPQINSRNLQNQVSLYLHRLKANSSSSQLISTPNSGPASQLNAPAPLPLSTSSPAPTSRSVSAPSSVSSASRPASSPALSPKSTLPASNSASSLLTPSSLLSPPRVAICLVGGARAFELTGPTIKKHLLQSVQNSDVFLHAPLDKDSYKLSLLKDAPNLMHVRIFSPKHISENRVFADVLTASNSPNGIQGLLQYFNLVEGCLDMINQVQLQQNFTYEWIIRTRLDGYWNNNFPPLNKRNHSAYTVPLGSQFGGLNDRLGIGNWETTKVALARLSLVPLLHAHGARGLNSESSFKQQLKVKRVSSKKSEFPFCILSHRRYGWPPGHWGVPVLSISSKGNLNGAKCRPCTPASTGASAKSIIEAEDRSWAWPGPIKEPELCNPVGTWESNWEDIFDKIAGPENARIRKDILNQTYSHCVQAVEVWRRHVAIWDAPIPSDICEKGLRKVT